MHDAKTFKRRRVAEQPKSNAEQGWGHGHGQENPREYYQPNQSMLDRRLRQLHDEPRSGGNQPAHQRMINRRFNDRASCFAQRRLYCEGNAEREATIFCACYLKRRT
jgi:hypothetical protein